MRSRAIALAVVFMMAPLGARAADLVVWWDKGFYAQEDEAIAEVVAAFEQKTGKQAELVHYPEEELPDKIGAALNAGRPPDIAYGLWIPENIGQWALNDWLVDLTGAWFNCVREGAEERQEMAQNGFGARHRGSDE